MRDYGKQKKMAPSILVIWCTHTFFKLFKYKILVLLRRYLIDELKPQIC